MKAVEQNDMTQLKMTPKYKELVGGLNLWAEDPGPILQWEGKLFEIENPVAQEDNYPILGASLNANQDVSSLLKLLLHNLKVKAQSLLS